MNALSHRGPDGEGLLSFQLPTADVWLGHRRLAILDLTEGGAQPMAGPHNTHIVFNGEVYNHPELARRFGIPVRTDSDTEVLIKGWAQHGTEFLAAIRGMYAAAMFALDSQLLSLVRDPVGKKPLYVYNSQDVFAVASELSAFRTLGLTLTQAPDSIANYFRLGYFPANQSIYQEVSKFPPGCVGTFSIADWSLKLQPFACILDGVNSTFDGTYTEAIEEFLRLLDESVALRLRSDVPVGIFLSGGIDSNLVLSSIAVNGGDVTAFSVKVDEERYNEIHIAGESANHFGIPLCEINVADKDFALGISDYLSNIDEPLGDISIVAMRMMAKEARHTVRVVLTGDGGDEAFVGYPWTSIPSRFARLRRLAKLPQWIRLLSSTVLKSSKGEQVIAQVAPWVGMNPETSKQKALFVQMLLENYGVLDLYDAIRLVRPQVGASSLWDEAHTWYPDYPWDVLASKTPEEAFSCLDMVTYMRDDVLVKVDRATMAFGVEARSPFLDTEIIKFGLSLPAEFKFQTGVVYKRILRDALRQRLPGRIVDQPKRGFGVPLPEAAKKREGMSEIEKWQQFTWDSFI